MQNNSEKALQIVNFEQAKKLKKLGFDWDCCNLYLKNNELEENDMFENFNDEIYGGCCSAPSIALALKWFREERELPNSIYLQADGYYAIEVFRNVKTDEWFEINRGYKFKNRYYSDILTTHEEAESALLDKLIELAEEDVENE
jgi:hypothetical protein